MKCLKEWVKVWWNSRQEPPFIVEPIYFFISLQIFVQITAHKSVTQDEACGCPWNQKLFGVQCWRSKCYLGFSRVRNIRHQQRDIEDWVQSRVAWRKLQLGSVLSHHPNHPCSTDKIAKSLSLIKSVVKLLSSDVSAESHVWRSSLSGVLIVKFPNESKNRKSKGSDGTKGGKVGERVDPEPSVSEYSGVSGECGSSGVL